MIRTVNWSTKSHPYAVEWAASTTPLEPDHPPGNSIRESGPGGQVEHIDRCQSSDTTDAAKPLGRVGELISGVICHCAVKSYEDRGVVQDGGVGGGDTCDRRSVADQCDGGAGDKAGFQGRTDWQARGCQWRPVWVPVVVSPR